MRLGYAENVILSAARMAQVRSDDNGEAPGSCSPAFVERFLPDAQREAAALEAPLPHASEVAAGPMDGAAIAAATLKRMMDECAEAIRDGIDLPEPEAAYAA